MKGSLRLLTKMFLGCVGVSMDEKFPQAEFSPYKNISYQWNPIVCNELLVRKDSFFVLCN